MPKILDSMDLQSKKPNFKRDSFKTLADMISYPEYSMPDNHRVTCDETPGVVYLFNSKFEVDANLGKYRKIIDTNTKNSSGSDEKVKLQSTSTDSKYMDEIIDKKTIQIDVTNNILVVKSLDGQEITITELNYLKGLDENLMDKLASFFAGGTKTYPETFATYADLESFDFEHKLDKDKTYLMYVATDESREGETKGAATIYLCDQTTNNAGNKPNYAGLAQAKQRDFTTNPVDVTKEITGIIPKDNLPKNIVYDNDSKFMKTEDYFGDDATKSVLKADTITNYTKQKTKNVYDNEHKHDNKEDVLDKLNKDGDGNLTFDGKKINSSFSLDKWNALIEYEAGELTIYNNKIYKCLIQHTSSNFKDDLESGNWELYVGDISNLTFEDWKENTKYEANKLIVYKKILYKCIVEHTSSESFDDDKNNWKIYIGGGSDGGIANILAVDEYSLLPKIENDDTLKDRQIAIVLNDEILEELIYQKGYYLFDLANNTWNIFKYDDMTSSDVSDIIKYLWLNDNTGTNKNYIVTKETLKSTMYSNNNILINKFNKQFATTEYADCNAMLNEIEKIMKGE